MKTVIAGVGGPGFTHPKAAFCEESYYNHATMDDRASRLKPCDYEREARDEHGDREGYVDWNAFPSQTGVHHERRIVDSPRSGSREVFGSIHFG